MGCPGETMNIRSQKIGWGEVASVDENKNHRVGKLKMLRDGGGVTGLSRATDFKTRAQSLPRRVISAFTFIFYLVLNI
jgi:hypothetical protein